MKRFFIIALGIGTLLAVIPVAGAPDPKAWANLREIDLVWQVDGEGLVSEVIEAPATSIGLTWEAEPPSAAWFRVQEAGDWGGWTRLAVEDDHGPDPGSAEAEGAIQGSELVWVGEVDAVQYLIEGGDSATRATMIDTTDRTKPFSQQFSNLFTDPTADAASAIPGRPTIRPRSAWDPTNTCAPAAPPSFVQVTHAYVHHTTGTNSYTASQVPSRILSVCLFHKNSRGWDDIGYNFLIDRFGVIWEGRAGGVDKGVQGAHTAGFNTYSFGVAFIGDHGGASPTAAAEAALVRLIAWKFGVHNVEPTKFSVVVSKGSEKWAEGRPVAFYPISGHRDAQSTSCPGEACYRRIPSFRSRVDALWNQVPLSTYRNPLVGDFDGDNALEAAIYRPGNGGWYVTETNGYTRTWAAFPTKSGWTSQVVGDFNGDGRDDIANYYPANGTWWVSRSTGSSFTTSRWADFSTGSGWSRQIVGDFNEDGRDDIANFHPASGTWWVSRSTGSSFSTTLWADFSTGSGWSRQIVGDFNGDGRDDIANYHPSNGTWWVARSGGSSFSLSRWADFSTSSGWTIQLVGDFNNDGRDDIANRNAGNGTWWVSRSNGSRFSTALWGTTATLDHLSHAWVQDVDNNGRDDILAVDAYNGFIRRQASTGSGFNIATLADTPWRTTVGGTSSDTLQGSAGWIYFGQEFQWIRLTRLNLSSAVAQTWATLTR